MAAAQEVKIIKVNNSTASILPYGYVEDYFDSESGGSFPDYSEPDSDLESKLINNIDKSSNKVFGRIGK